MSFQVWLNLIQPKMSSINLSLFDWKQMKLAHTKRIKDQIDRQVDQSKKQQREMLHMCVIASN